MELDGHWAGGHGRWAATRVDLHGVKEPVVTTAGLWVLPTPPKTLGGYPGAVWSRGHRAGFLLDLPLLMSGGSAQLLHPTLLPEVACILEAWADEVLSWRWRHLPRSPHWDGAGLDGPETTS